MESFEMKKAATTTFGLIHRGNTSDMEKMKPHFFRVMLDFMLKDAKIYIPTVFVKKYGSRLIGTASVMLKDANGDTWEVDLATDGEGLIWLVEGWEDFTRHHSLKQGDILVFRLEPDNSFRVMGFEPTTSEKKCGRRSSKDVKLKEVKVEEEVGFGIGRKEDEGCHVSAGKLELKQKKDGKEEGCHGKLELNQKQKNEKGCNRGEEKRKEKLVSPLNHVPIKLETPPPNHESKTVIRGIPEPSGKNPSFSITIREYHMKRRRICLPTRIVFEHMLLGNGTTPERRTVMVCAEVGFDSWRLYFVCRLRGDRGSGLGEFIGGWPAFSHENSMKPGDVCWFEILSDSQMKVTVQRN